MAHEYICNKISIWINNFLELEWIIMNRCGESIVHSPESSSALRYVRREILGPMVRPGNTWRAYRSLVPIARMSLQSYSVFPHCIWHLQLGLWSGTSKNYIRIKWGVPGGVMTMPVKLTCYETERFAWNCQKSIPCCRWRFSVVSYFRRFLCNCQRPAINHGQILPLFQ